MNRRSLLTTLGLAPVMALPTMPALATPSVDIPMFSAVVHEPLSRRERDSIDAMTDKELQEMSLAYREYRFGDFCARCNSAFTLGGGHENSESPAFRRYLLGQIPLINSGHAHAVNGMQTPIIEHAFHRMNIKASLGPFIVTGMKSEVKDASRARARWTRHAMQFTIPGAALTGHFTPSQYSSAFGR